MIQVRPRSKSPPPRFQWTGRITPRLRVKGLLQTRLPQTKISKIFSSKSIQVLKRKTLQINQIQLNSILILINSMNLWSSYHSVKEPKLHSCQTILCSQPMRPNTSKDTRSKSNWAQSRKGFRRIQRGSATTSSTSMKTKLKGENWRNSSKWPRTTSTREPSTLEMSLASLLMSLKTTSNSIDSHRLWPSRWKPSTYVCSLPGPRSVHLGHGTKRNQFERSSMVEDHLISTLIPWNVKMN